MARDSGIGLAERDEDGASIKEDSDMVDNDDDPSLQRSVPSLQADIAKFPENSMKDMKIARGLWATNTILLRCQGPQVEIHQYYISKDLICAMSISIRKLVLESRAWPIVEWDLRITGMWSSLETWLWMPEFIQYLHTSTREFDSLQPSATSNAVDEWCLGRALDCIPYQDVCMKDIMRIAAETEPRINMYHMAQEMLNGIYENLTIRQDEGPKERAFFECELFRYILDVLLWEGTRGSWEWLSIIKDGGCVAAFIARAQVEAAKKPAPRYPPWHPFNRHKYLINSTKSASKRKISSGEEVPRKRREGLTFAEAARLLEEKGL